MKDLKNLFPVEKKYGILKIFPGPEREEYDISKARMSVETVGKNILFNLWSECHLYEVHGGKKISVGEFAFEILLPLNFQITGNKEINLHFPLANSEIHENWEILFYSHFYRFEHLKISNCRINIIPKNEIYSLKLKGYITEDVERFFENYYFESTLEIPLSTKIHSKFNWNYSEKNENALNAE